VKIAVLGGGSWGTALANVLAHKGGEVWLWARREEVVEEIRATGRNARYLPGLALSPNLRASTDLSQVMAGISCAVLAVPCQHLARFLRQHRDHFPVRASLVCASKGNPPSKPRPWRKQATPSTPFTACRAALGKRLPDNSLTKINSLITTLQQVRMDLSRRE